MSNIKLRKGNLADYLKQFSDGDQHILTVQFFVKYKSLHLPLQKL